MKKIFGASVVVVAIGAVIYLVGYGNDAVNENQSGTDTTAVTDEQTTEDGNGGLNEEPLPGDDIGETDDAGAKSEAIVVKIDFDKIYVDDVLCNNIEDMKKAIVDDGRKKLEFVHTDASQSVYVEVKKELEGIEQTLDISIEYNVDDEDIQ